MEAINLISAENVEGRIDVARAVGSADSVMYVYDLPPGSASSPYHYEYKEEWLLVVAGTVVVRVPEGERTLEAGDVTCFRPGPAGAHRIMNRGDAPARTLLWSSGSVPAVSVYPDSGKIGVWLDNEADDGIFLQDSVVAWAHGEEGWNRAD